MPRKPYGLLYVGTFVLLSPLTGEFRRWLKQHTDPDNSTWYGGDTLVVEPRYLEALEASIARDYRPRTRRPRVR